MKHIQPHRIKTISEYHKHRGLPKPEHPLVSVIHFDELEHLNSLGTSFVFDFYSIALKRNFDAKVKYKYGQQSYDFDEGVMFFISPNQVFSIETDGNYKLSGWMLLIHPDFFSQTALAKSIKQYEYFSYSANEALHLSDKEEAIVVNIFKSIQQEYHSNIDKFSQQLIISQIEFLLIYSDRFYHRQFITRKINGHQILIRLEQLLKELFENGKMLENGLPTVQYIAQALNVSPNYLSSLLKQLTGESTQQHIQNKLVEKAKEKLATTDLSISEIAYQLGFEYPQSFSKIFKSKTNFSPLQFRQSFN
ncbi:helix-turn-helix domain-containing protein [Flavihumibacter sp. UBA7668]|uniref:helix-turn-helix domain-containing protein n=1 Tax=Flavihumibacter sp. UBA7668 TaxID=1946542 RepID=UPI0025B8BDD7|nr:helix-turn-helix transcriptional regulator [Flavihumibacter sp. UBA7668]